MLNENNNLNNQTDNQNETTQKPEKPKNHLFGNFDFVYGFLLGLFIMFTIGGSTFYVYYFGIPPFINDYINHRGSGNAYLSLASASELQAGDKGTVSENPSTGETAPSEGGTSTIIDGSIIRTKPEYDRKYLVQYLSTPMYFKAVNAFLGGGTRQRISRGNLSEIDIPIPPTVEEQTKIGECFSNLDNLITLHQRKQIIIMEDEK